MDKSNQILTEILEAREKRAFLRIKYVEQGLNTLSLSLNIPGYPKSNSLVLAFFNVVLSEMKSYLLANQVSIQNIQEQPITDQAGNFFLIPLNDQSTRIEKIKQLTENFEISHSCGRIIDIDIFDKQGRPISSGKEKLCYVCEKHSAVSCMRNKRHGYGEIRNKMFQDISNFLKEKRKEDLINKLSSIAVKSILYEISLSPKPGLVDMNNSGSHKDMDFFSFLDSSAALSPFFKEFCLLGYNYSGITQDILPKIRFIGLQAEKAMFDVTGNVNTQKGIIFLFGICLFSIAKILSVSNTFSETEFQQLVKKIAKNMVANELGNSIVDIKTHGEKVYSKYGLIGAGARYEVETGFQTVFQTALPYFELNKLLFLDKKQNKTQEILRNGLLKIMAKNNDSNILYRSNLESLGFVKKLAEKSFNNIEEYKKLCDFCSLKNISPGGSADLLAVSLLLHFVKTDINIEKIAEVSFCNID